MWGRIMGQANKICTTRINLTTGIGYPQLSVEVNYILTWNVQMAEWDVVMVWVDTLLQTVVVIILVIS